MLAPSRSTACCLTEGLGSCQAMHWSAGIALVRKHTDLQRHFQSLLAFPETCSASSDNKLVSWVLCMSSDAGSTTYAADTAMPGQQACCLC